MKEIKKIIEIKRNRQVVAEFRVKDLMTKEEWESWRKLNNILQAFSDYESYNRVNELKELAKRIPKREVLEKRALKKLY